MKKVSFLIFLVSALLSACTPIVFQQAPAGNYDHRDDRRITNDAPVVDENAAQTNQLFYDELSPYGTWVDYPDYGYVWVPAVDNDFKPYVTNGSWVYSDFGWTWASDYEWGWATFHYGRWFFDDNYGWVWAPGDEWAPAWVTWGYSGDYYCWAPIPPRVSMSDARMGFWHPDASLWNVVPGQQFTRAHVSSFIIYDNFVRNNIQVIINDGNYKRNMIHRGANGFTEYNRGPQLFDVERRTNRPIPTIGIVDNKSPGAAIIENNQLRIYRPFINHDGQANNISPTPKKYDGYRNNQGNQSQPGVNGSNNNQPARPQWNRPAARDPKQDNPNNNGQNQPQPASPDQHQQHQTRAGEPVNPAPANNNNQNQPAIKPPGNQPAQPAQQNDRNPSKNFSPPAQPQPQPAASQNPPKTQPPVTQPPASQPQPQLNPVFRPNLQPVHPPDGQKKKNATPNTKPDTVKRRPNNQ